MDERRVTFSVGILESTRDWLKKYSMDNDLSIGAMINALAQSAQAETIVYDNGTWIGGTGDSLDTRIHEEEVKRLTTTIKLYEAKIAGLEEQLRDAEANRAVEVPKIEEKAVEKPVEKVEKPKTDHIQDGINLNELFRLAAKHRITEQSLLDSALRRYR